MTLIDFIKLEIVKSHEQAEEFAADLVDRWHANQIPGELNDVLGLTPREYQAWATGHVSLLTIAHWHKTSHPPLDSHRPWFKKSGVPPQEVVGYLNETAHTPVKQSRKKTGAASK